MSTELANRLHLEYDDQLLVDLLAGTGLLLAAIQKLPNPGIKP